MVFSERNQGFRIGDFDWRPQVSLCLGTEWLHSTVAFKVCPTAFLRVGNAFACSFGHGFACLRGVVQLGLKLFNLHRQRCSLMFQTEERRLKKIYIYLHVQSLHPVGAKRM